MGTRTYIAAMCTWYICIYWYTRYCCLLLYPLSSREAFGLCWFYRVVIVYRIVETFRYDTIVSLSNDNIETFDTISNTNVYARGSIVLFTLKTVTTLVKGGSRDDRP